MRRIVLIFALTACASPAFAVQDRYGPPSAQPSPVRDAALPPGSLLTWAGKVAAPQAQPEPVGMQRPAPLSPWAERLAGAQPQAEPRAVAQAPAQTLVMASPEPVRRASPAPAAAPPPYAAPVAPAPPLVAATTQARPQPASAPQPLATRVAPPPPVRTAEAPGATERPRFYSVARQYGAQPDPIPVAAPLRGQALTLADIPTSENLGRSQAPLDDGRTAQAVAIPDTRQNAASNRISRLGL